MKRKELILMKHDFLKSIDFNWNNELCEPVIISYNRSAQLDKTLSAFYQIAHSGMRMHVLDNASTDNTEALVKTWQSKWPNLIYHKNSYNIGGNANIFRSLELTQSEYSWTIGDDDAWYLENLSLLITALASRKADIIRLGWLVARDEQAELISANQLIHKESFFFSSVSMISATIIRRELMTKALPYAYHNIANAYPQLAPILVALNSKDLVVYSLGKALMVHQPSMLPGYHFGDLEWYMGWFAIAALLKSKQQQVVFRKEILRYMTKPQKSMFHGFSFLLKVSINFKAFGVNQGKYLAKLFIMGEGLRLGIFVISLIYALTPKFLAKTLQRIYYKSKGKSYPELKQDRSRI